VHYGWCAQVMLQRFAERHKLWLAAVEAVAELDALMSLAIAAASGDGDMCRSACLCHCFCQCLTHGTTWSAVPGMAVPYASVHSSAGRCPTCRVSHTLHSSRRVSCFTLQLTCSRVCSSEPRRCPPAPPPPPPPRGRPELVEVAPGPEHMFEAAGLHKTEL